MRSCLFKIVVTALLAITGVALAATCVWVFGLQQEANPPSSSVETEAAAERVVVPSRDPLALEYLENGLCFDQLEEPLRRQYNSILAQIAVAADRETFIEDGVYGLSVTLYDYDHTDDSVAALLYAVSQDHPELFFLKSSYSYRIYKDRLFVDLEYHMSAEERIEAAAQMAADVEVLLSSCVTEDAYETELRLHDALLSGCTYDHETAESDELDEAHWDMSSPFAAISQGRAICGGYARAMQLLLNRAGIGATLVYNENHVWNLVWIDGEVYHLDPTWNDADDRVVSHVYFNVTDEEIVASRSVIAQSVTLPRAVSTAANYFHREGVYIAELTAANIEAAIAKTRDTGVVELRFSPSVYDDALLFIQGDAVFDLLRNDDALWEQFVYFRTDSVCVLTLLSQEA